MKEELTEKMHSEFTVTHDIEIKHRAGCVWGMLKWEGKIDDKESVIEWSRIYDITYNQAMKWKTYWMEVIK